MTPRLPLFILRLLSISLVSLRSAFGSVELCSDRELPWLFRKRLAFYHERKVKPRGLNDSARFSLPVVAMVQLAKCLSSRKA